MLVRYILPELSSENHFMRCRACQVYGTFKNMKFSDNDHIKQIVVGIFKNMSVGNPLPVKFDASRSLD